MGKYKLIALILTGLGCIFMIVDLILACLASEDTIPGAADFGRQLDQGIASLSFLVLVIALVMERVCRGKVFTPSISA